MHVYRRSYDPNPFYPNSWNEVNGHEHVPEALDTLQLNLRRVCPRPQPYTCTDGIEAQGRGLQQYCGAAARRSLCPAQRGLASDQVSVLGAQLVYAATVEHEQKQSYTCDRDSNHFTKSTLGAVAATIGWE
jgi:hypothetical protein